MSFTRLCALALLVLAGCDTPPADPDASADSGVDAGRRDAGHDPGPMCMPACGPTEDCCPAAGGGDASCVDLRNDPRHCGVCEIDCVTSHRGDGCSASQCTCGTVALGCTGNRQSWCCPPRRPGTEAYCADIDRSAADCGGCGVECDLRRADRCDGGRCVCGDTRDQCEGTPESTCCTEGVDTACVDTTSDTFHCGGCNIPCSVGERCEEGTCTLGAASCPGGCSEGEICCNGACCARGRCGSGCGGAGADGGI